MESSLKSSIVRVLLAAFIAAVSVMFDAQRAGNADADSGFRFGISTVAAWGEDDCPPEEQQCDEDDGVDDGNDGVGGGGGGGGLHRVRCHLVGGDENWYCRPDEKGGTGCKFNPAGGCDTENVGKC